MSTEERRKDLFYIIFNTKFVLERVDVTNEFTDVLSLMSYKAIKLIGKNCVDDKIEELRALYDSVINYIMILKAEYMLTKMISYKNYERDY